MDGQFSETKPVIVRHWPVAKRGDRFTAKIGQVAQWFRGQIYRSIPAADFQRTAVLFYVTTAYDFLGTSGRASQV
jgi:hypothetical protein